MRVGCAWQPLNSRPPPWWGRRPRGELLHPTPSASQRTTSQSGGPRRSASRMACLWAGSTSVMKLAPAGSGCRALAHFIALLAYIPLSVAHRPSRALERSPLLGPPTPSLAGAESRTAGRVPPSDVPDPLCGLRAGAAHERHRDPVSARERRLGARAVSSPAGACRPGLRRFAASSAEIGLPPLPVLLFNPQHPNNLQHGPASAACSVR